MRLGKGSDTGQRKILRVDINHEPEYIGNLNLMIEKIQMQSVFPSILIFCLLFLLIFVYLERLLRLVMFLCINGYRFPRYIPFACAILDLLKYFNIQINISQLTHDRREYLVNKRHYFSICNGSILL